MAKKPKLEKGSLMILIAMGFLPLVIAALEKFSILNYSSQMSSILVLLGSFFIANEQLRKHGSKLLKQTSSIVLILLVGLAFISSLATLIGYAIPQLAPLEGLLLLVIIVSGIVELRN